MYYGYMNWETSEHEWREAWKEFKGALDKFWKRLWAIYIHILSRTGLLTNKILDKTDNLL